MIRLDGNAVFLSAYNRNTTIAKNDVSWNGDTGTSVVGLGSDSAWSLRSSLKTHGFADTVFAAWGITGKCVNEKCDRKLDWPVGPDGRNGEQPRGTRVMFNMVREIGIWQKQSSMWFQAVTAQSHLVGNVHFNGVSTDNHPVSLSRGGNALWSCFVAHSVRWWYPTAQPRAGLNFNGVQHTGPWDHSAWRSLS
jgi:hypothetical protein